MTRIIISLVTFLVLTAWPEVRAADEQAPEHLQKRGSKIGLPGNTAQRPDEIVNSTNPSAKVLQQLNLLLEEKIKRLEAEIKRLNEENAKLAKEKLALQEQLKTQGADKESPQSK